MKAEVQPNRILKSGINYARWIVFLQLVVLLILFFKLRATAQLEKEAIESRVKAEMTEKTTLEFMQRTVARWEKLGDDNPDVKVPEVNEPPITPPK